MLPTQPQTKLNFFLFRCHITIVTIRVHNMRPFSPSSGTDCAPKKTVQAGLCTCLSQFLGQYVGLLPKQDASQMANAEGTCGKEECQIKIARMRLNVWKLLG